MKKTVNKSLIKCCLMFVLTFCISMIPVMLPAQDQKTLQPMPLFRSDEPLELVLEADFSAVFAAKDDTTYFPAKMILTDNDGQPRTVDLNIRKRGLTRARKDVCSFPPLRLNFPKKEMINTPFEGQNSIKLVTHCDKPDFYEDYTASEYLIYKSFNILTDSSFRVRPANIKYVFSNKKADTIYKFAFFLEREKHIAERLQGTELEKESIHPAQVDPGQACLVDIFEYMIGNTDYSIYELHNIIIVAEPERKHLSVPVPYDFDWSGLISANYAVPNPALNISHVSERVYRGLKRDPAIISQTLEKFRSEKSAIYSLFETSPFLSANARKKAIKYLDGFYELINDEKKAKSVFLDNAREVNNE